MTRNYGNNTWYVYFIKDEILFFPHLFNNAVQFSKHGNKFMRCLQNNTILLIITNLLKIYKPWFTINPFIYILMVKYKNSTPEIAAR